MLNRLTRISIGWKPDCSEQAAGAGERCPAAWLAKACCFFSKISKFCTEFYCTRMEQC